MTQAYIIGAADAIVSDLAMDNREYKKLPLRTRVQLLDRQSFNNLTSFLDCPNLQGEVTDVIGLNRSLFDDYGFQDTIRRAGGLGLSGGECHTVDNGGASVASALLMARRMIAEDEHRVILLIGSDIPKSGLRGQADYAVRNKDNMEPDFEYAAGGGLIPQYALLGQALYKKGVTEEDYRVITTFYRKLAQRDARANTFGKELTHRQLDRYLATPYSAAMVALADDHGFCALITGPARLNEFSKGGGLAIMGGAVKSYGKYFIRRNGFSSPAIPAVREAYGRTGLSPADVDYAWIYDCFTGMLVQQAADYFGLEPKQAAAGLRTGILAIPNGKTIQVNAHANLLNYQAAINNSGGTGLIDIGRRYGFAPGIPEDADTGVGPSSDLRHAARPGENIILMGGNGGIDTSNGVVFLARNLNGLPPGARRGGQGLSQQRPQGGPPPNEPEFEDGERGVIDSSTEVRFNPDPAYKPPYVLCAVRRNDGNITLARLADSQGELIRPADRSNRRALKKGPTQPAVDVKPGMTVQLTRSEQWGILAVLD